MDDPELPVARSNSSPQCSRSDGIRHRRYRCKASSPLAGARHVRDQRPLALVVGEVRHRRSIAQIVSTKRACRWAQRLTCTKACNLEQPFAACTAVLPSSGHRGLSPFVPGIACMPDLELTPPQGAAIV